MVGDRFAAALEHLTDGLRRWCGAELPAGLATRALARGGPVGMTRAGVTAAALSCAAVHRFFLLLVCRSRGLAIYPRLCPPTAWWLPIQRCPFGSRHTLVARATTQHKDKRALRATKREPDQLYCGQRLLLLHRLLSRGVLSCCPPGGVGSLFKFAGPSFVDPACFRGSPLPHCGPPPAHWRRGLEDAILRRTSSSPSMALSMTRWTHCED